MKLWYGFLLSTLFLSGALFAQVDPPNPLTVDQIKFVSQPPLTGQVGVVYAYTAKAVSNDSTAIVYYLAPPPTMNFIMPMRSLVVDSATGLLTFTPTSKGWYLLTVIARSTKGGVAIRRFTVTVTGGNGIVQGKVTDTLNTGIKGVVVELLKTELTSVNQPDGHDGNGNFNDFQGEGGFLFWAITDASGNYRITGVDPGKYKLHAISPSRQYRSQWYDGQPTASLANVIFVDTSAVSIASFILRGGASTRPKLTISGSVSDTLGVAIKKADVFFVLADFALNTNNTIDDFRKYFDVNANISDCKLDGNSQHVIHVRVDSAGNYTASVPVGTYIAFAKAQGYESEYYQEQSSLLLATQISVQQNTTGINFTLAPLPPVVLGAIKGNVTDSSSGVGVPARIIASRDRWSAADQFKGSRTYIVDTDSLGAYTLDQLPPGSYFVFALPLGIYAPAYYSNDTANTHWKKASKVIVNGNTVEGITIYVHQLPVSANGYTGISGMVRTTNAMAVQGAIVYAMKNNRIAGYAITGIAGAYTIDGLAPGSYSVSVDNLGSNESASLTVTIAYSTTNAAAPITAAADFSITSTTGVSRGSVDQPVQFSLSQNYPNPFNPTTVIHYAILRPGIVSLKVFNILGQEMLTLVNTYQTVGNYQVTFDARSLASGVYFYQLQSNRAIQLRKMILLR